MEYSERGPSCRMASQPWKEDATPEGGAAQTAGPNQEWLHGRLHETGAGVDRQEGNLGMRLVGGMGGPEGFHFEK